MIFWLCVIFVLLLMFLYFGAILTHSNQGRSTEFYNSAYDVSVIIPFRNEAENLPKLLDSIAKLASKPKEIIFVNDHSDDKSVEILQKSNLLIEILNLESGIYGKKQALHKGIEKSIGTYILTWDADVQVPRNYFEILQKHKKVDCLILPVKMNASNFLGTFASLDYYFLNAISYACGKISQYLVASGANFLFKKELYFSYFKAQSSFHFSSGDDAFLLQFAKKKKATISALLFADLTVETTSPSSIKSFLNQRFRWLGKTKNVGNKFAYFVGMLGVLYQLVFFILITNYPKFWEFIFLSKIMIEFLIFSPYLLKIKHFIVLFFSPIFSFIYPFYLVFILISISITSIEWKGRAVQ